MEREKLNLEQPEIKILLLVSFLMCGQTALKKSKKLLCSIWMTNEEMKYRSSIPDSRKGTESLTVKREASTKNSRPISIS
jgi:hypothetical protein